MNLPDDTLPRGAVQVVQLLQIDAHVVVLVQLKPVHLAILVPPDRLQTHFIWILLIDDGLELNIVIKLAFTQILRKEKQKK